MDDSKWIKFPIDDIKLTGKRDTSCENRPLIFKMSKLESDESYVLDISTSTLKKTLCQIKYNGEGLGYDKKVEESCFPPVITTFYAHIYQYGNIVESAEYMIKEYLRKPYFQENKDNKELIDVVYKNYRQTYRKCGIEWRLQRMYPSLIRDFYTFLLLTESGKFDSVEYDTLKDYEEGIDLTVQYHGKKYTLALYIDTKRGNEFYKRKNHYRHKSQADFQLKLKDHNTIKCNDIYVYNPAIVDAIVAEINKMDK